MIVIHLIWELSGVLSPNFSLKMKMKSKNQLYLNNTPVKFWVRNRKGLEICNNLLDNISTDFSSQYGSERSFSYTARNCLGTPSRFPSYGDYPQTYVPRFIPHFELVLLVTICCTLQFLATVLLSFPKRVLVGNFALKSEI